MSNTIQVTEDTLTITRVINAPRERVFAAWSDPDQVEAWSGCAGATSLGATMDFRVSGGYRHTIRIPNGSELTMCGTYTAIEAPRLISYTLEWEKLPVPATTVSVEFVAAGEKTEIRLTHAGLSAPEMRAEVPKGWTAALDKLAETFAKGQ